VPPSPVKSPERAPTEYRFSAQFPLALTRPSSSPPGFEGDALLAPYAIRFSLRNPPSLSNRATFQLEAAARFARYSLIPILEATPSLAWAYAHGEFEIGMELADQQTIGKSPFQNSQFDLLIGAPRVKGLFAVSPTVSLGIEGRWLFVNKTQMGNFENLKTDIDHKGTSVVTPSVVLNLPENFGMEGALDIYSVGDTAIASKEFAYSIPSETLERLRISAERRFGRLGIEASFAWVMGVRDSVELPYQAPFLTRDYLLSPKTLTLGVSWKI
jgi:hypothetical protein